MSPNAKSGRVIVTYGRSLMALTAAHSLGKRGIEVIGCDDVGMTVMHFSKYVEKCFIHAPYQDELEQYLDDMERFIRKYKPADDRPYILMPMFRDAKILSEHRARFDSLITLAVPDIDAINQVNTKDVFATTCERLGLSIPNTIQSKDFAKIEALKDDLQFPLLIKAIDDVGGRGIHKARNFQELQEHYNKSVNHYGNPPLIQEIIEGRDYCVSTLCNNGEVVAHMAYKNLYQYPRDSGAGIMRETIDDAPFMEDTRALLGALNWHGIAQIDFRWSGNEADPAYLIEVNPRFWAGLFHSVESGVDFPWLLYQLAAFGKISEESHVRIGAKTKVPGLWTVSALQDIIDSETHFDELKEVWRKTWSANKDETWRNKFSNLGNALKSSIDAKDISEKIKAMREMGKGAKSEFESEDDPFTGLGFLFVASSLIRHGELPPELKK